jgi:hypothetical protein
MLPPAIRFSIFTDFSKPSCSSFFYCCLKAMQELQTAVLKLHGEKLLVKYIQFSRRSEKSHTKQHAALEWLIQITTGGLCEFYEKI